MNGKNTTGMWDDEERCLHINELELKAAYMGVLSLCKDLTNCHLRPRLDNSTAVAYINNMGGTHSPECNDITHSF